MREGGKRGQFEDQGKGEGEKGGREGRNCKKNRRRRYSNNV
jgi:hypothetical protein